MSNDKKPAIRFKDYSDDWEQRKFGDIGSVAMCKRIFKEQTDEEGEVPFYKIGTFGGEPDAFISRELFDEYKSNYSYPNKGDILISASGSIGRTVEFTGKDEYFQDSNIVWLKHGNKIDNSFLKVLYGVVAWSCEGSTIKRLYNDNFLKTEFMLPRIEEQIKLGEYFSNLDNLIALHQRKYDKLQNLKKAMLEKMFPKNGSNVPEIRFKGFTDAWEQRKLGDCLSLITYGFTNPMEDTESGPWKLTAKDIGDGYIDYSTARHTSIESYKKLTNKSKPVVGDLLLTKDGTLGRTALVDTNNICINQSVALLRCDEILSANYLNILLKSPRYQNEMLENAGGGTIKHIYITKVDKMFIDIPDIEEQEYISKYFANLGNLITLHQRELEKLKNIKKAMLEKMFV